MEAGEGRHPTSALKKNTASVRGVATGLRHPALKSYWSPLPKAEVASASWPNDRRRWFMFGRWVADVSRKVPSLLKRVSLEMKPQVVFVLGGPGAGKGTQCSRIVEVSRQAKTRRTGSSQAA